MIGLNKIDSSLLYAVKNLSNNTDKINCVLYTNSINKTKKFIKDTNCCEIQKEYPFINALGIKISPSCFNKLCGFKHLEYLTSSAKVFTQVSIAKDVSNLQLFYNEDNYGQDVTVAIIDTGITPHLDFTCPSNRIIYFKDFISNKSYAYDDNGHGTFVASVLGGNGFVSGKKLSGVAPKVKIISLKALDEKGETGAFTILEAMQWIYDNKDKFNIKVVCMSFGSNPLGNTDPLKVGAEMLWDNGIVVVAAAGNSGPNMQTIKSPGISSKIITVGAFDDGRDKEDEENQDFKIAEFSSRGPAYRFYKPDIVASGVNLVGASNNLTKHYTKMSGTSVATPIIAGTCALFLNKYKNATPSQIKSIILSNTKSITGNRNLEGYGYLKIKTT